MQARFALIVAFAAIVSATFTDAQEVEPYALKGGIVTPDQVLPEGLITVVGPQIKEVTGSAEKRGGLREIETGSFIFPGLIDLHDHITWNLFPRWKPGSEFSNRYEWQQKSAYKIALDTPHRKLFENHDSACNANEYGEIKAIVGGATSVIGSLGPSPKPEPDNQCIIGLARNLDFNSGFYGQGTLNNEKLKNEVFPLELTTVDASRIQSDLDSGRLTSFIVHIAEGKPSDASSAREFRMLDRQGFLRRGVSIIHGVALAVRGESLDSQWEKS